jgi:hypothetical protein
MVEEIVGAGLSEGVDTREPPIAKILLTLSA